MNLQIQKSISGANSTPWALSQKLKKSKNQKLNLWPCIKKAWAFQITKEDNMTKTKKFGVLWKRGCIGELDLVEDIYFDSKEEAITYIGIETMNMCVDDIENVKIIGKVVELEMNDCESIEEGA